MARRPRHRPAHLDLGDACAGPIAQLARRLRRIHKNRAQARDIHRLRSACRRLEAMLEDLVGIEKSHRKASRICEDVQMLRKRAGKVRDADVASELIKHATRAFGSAGNDIWIALDDQLMIDRDESLDRLADTAARRKIAGLPDRLASLLKRRRLPADRLVRIILEQIRHTHQLAKRPLTIPKDLHQTRLAIKRIRDLAELAAPALGAPARTLAARAKRLTDRLGRAQDLVVLIEMLDDAAERKNPPKGLADFRRTLIAWHLRAHTRAVAALAGLRSMHKISLPTKHRAAAASLPSTRRLLP